MIGDDRKALRALFNLFLKSKNLSFSGEVRERFHKVLGSGTTAEEAIRIGVEITNPLSQEAKSLIEIMGGDIPETNCQIVFKMTASQSNKKKGRDEDETGDMFDGDNDSSTNET